MQDTSSVAVGPNWLTTRTLFRLCGRHIYLLFGLLLFGALVAGGFLRVAAGPVFEARLTLVPGSPAVASTGGWERLLAERLSERPLHAAALNAAYPDAQERARGRRLLLGGFALVPSLHYPNGQELIVQGTSRQAAARIATVLAGCLAMADGCPAELRHPAVSARIATGPVTEELDPRLVQWWLGLALPFGAVLAGIVRLLAARVGHERVAVPSLGEGTWTKVAGWVLLAAMAGAVLLDLKRFEIGQQVAYYWHAGYGAADLLMAGHPHFSRYALVVPFFLVGDWLAIPPDRLFGLACIFGLYGLARLMTAVARLEMDAARARLLGLVYAGAMYGLAFFMNGRGVLVFLGLGLLLAATTLLLARRAGWHGGLTGIGAGLWLTSISSGSFVVAVALCLAWSVQEILRLRRAGGASPDTWLAMLVGGWLLAFLALPLLGQYLQKNWAYFGGDGLAAVRMLHHGLGGVLARFGLGLLLLGGLLGGCALWVGGRRLARSGKPVGQMFGFACLAAGLFGFYGFLTLAMALVPVLYLTVSVILRSERLGRLFPCDKAGAAR